jgi:hypothetical protein
MRNAYKSIVRKPEENGAVGRLRWEDGSKIGGKETGCEGVD